MILKFSLKTITTILLISLLSSCVTLPISEQTDDPTWESQTILLEPEKKKTVKKAVKKEKKVEKKKPPKKKTIPEPKIEKKIIKPKEQAKEKPTPVKKEKSIKEKEVKKNPVKIAVNKMILPNHETNPFLLDNSFVTNWTVVGPFKFNLNDIKDKNIRNVIHKEFLMGEAILDGSEKANDLKWQTISFKGANPSGKIDLNKLYPNADFSVAYAITKIEVPKHVSNVSLYIGCNDFIKIWLNGKLVHTYNNELRESDWDQDIVRNLTLNEGTNTVVVKTVNLHDNWSFFFRFTNKDGMPICRED